MGVGVGGDARHWRSVDLDGSGGIYMLLQIFFYKSD